MVKRSDSWYGNKPDVVSGVGYARLRDGTTAKHVYNVLGSEMEIDQERGTVLEVSCTTLPSHGNEILRRFFLGKSLEKHHEFITREIRRRCIVEHAVRCWPPWKMSFLEPRKQRVIRQINS